LAVRLDSWHLFRIAISEGIANQVLQALTQLHGVPFQLGKPAKFDAPVGPRRFSYPHITNANASRRPGEPKLAGRCRRRCFPEGHKEAPRVPRSFL
jgi:hypothetical protein